MSKPRLRGMVCNRNPKNLSREPNLATKLRRQSRMTKKQPFKCNGGLLDGEKLWLSCAGTMVFTIAGKTGFYDHDMNWCEV